MFKRSDMHWIPSVTLFTLLTLAGCGGGSSTPQPVTPAQPVAATELTLSAAATDASVGGPPVALSTVLNGAGTVAWQLATGGAGTLSAASGASVSYAPPATSDVNAVAKVSITATSGGLSKTITLNLLPDSNKPSLTLLAGNTTIVAAPAAPVDGVGAAARFVGAGGITVDAGGNAYVTENTGSAKLLRKIAPDGSVTTLISGVGNSYTNYYTSPTAAVDGSVYFNSVQPATSREHSVSTYKLGSDGKQDYVGGGIYTFSGQGGDVLASPDGKIYRLHNYSINLLLADGKVRQFVGASIDDGTADGSGVAARFSLLEDVAVDKNGTLFALDQGSVRQITPAGVVTTLARFPSIAAPYGSAIAAPAQIGVDGDGNVLLLYVSQDLSYYEIRKLSGGAIVPLYQVGTPQGPYRIRPGQMAVQRDGTLLLTHGTIITRLRIDGTTKVLAGTQDASYPALDGDGDAARYVDPGLLAADAAGNIYSVEDVSNFYKLKTVIRKTTPAGKVSTYANLNLGMDISGMVVTPAGQLMVSMMPPGSSNTFGGGVYQVEAGNKFTLIAGVPVLGDGTPRQQDGNGVAARFGGPTLAGVDSGGNLYVRDRVSATDASTTVRKITPQAVVSTIAALPAGLNAAPDGNSYQLDPATPGIIYRVTPAGVKTIFVGSSDASGIVLGALPGQLTAIRSVVPSGANSLAVATESAILKVVLPK